MLPCKTEPTSGKETVLSFVKCLMMQIVFLYIVSILRTFLGGTSKKTTLNRNWLSHCFFVEVNQRPMHSRNHNDQDLFTHLKGRSGPGPSVEFSDFFQSLIDWLVLSGRHLGPSNPTMLANKFFKVWKKRIFNNICYILLFRSDSGRKSAPSSNLIRDRYRMVECNCNTEDPFSVTVAQR